MNIRTFRIGGIHPEENKLTHEAKTQGFCPHFLISKRNRC